jgi:hypothetical protein
MNWNKIFPTHLSFCCIAGGVGWILLGLTGIAPPQAYLIAAAAFAFAYFDVLNHFRAGRKR